MNQITYYILNKVRFVLCVPFLMVLGLITCPLTLLFQWQGFWIIWIANIESCSLSEAKRIISENIKYPDICKVYYGFLDKRFNNISFSNDIGYKPIHQESSSNSNDKFNQDYYCSLAYSWSPVNIHHDPRRDN